MHRDVPSKLAGGLALPRAVVEVLVPSCTELTPARDPSCKREMRKGWGILSLKRKRRRRRWRLPRKLGARQTGGRSHTVQCVKTRHCSLVKSAGNSRRTLLGWLPEPVEGLREQVWSSERQAGSWTLAYDPETLGCGAGLPLGTVATAAPGTQSWSLPAAR